VRSGPVQHGTYNGYTNYRCRCRHCKDANNAFERQRTVHRRFKDDPAGAARNDQIVRDRVTVWKLAYELGAAGRIADEIIANRPVPARLLAAVMDVDLEAAA
jgi:hypothetical protein